MNEKEKAIQLYERCYYKLDKSMPEISKDFYAKTFANLIIDEIKLQSNNYGINSNQLYWQRVKTELNNL